MKSKNPHYKSISQFYNASTQTLTTSASALTLVGIEVTDTGVAIDVDGNAIAIEYPGVYEIKITVVVDATAAGDVTIQLYLNGMALPETAKTITVAAGNNEITVDTIRYLRSCNETAQIQLMANTDGTAAGSVVMIDGNVVKIA